MRTIKFRAKSIDGYWVSGDLHLQCKYPHIHTAERRSVPIDPKTIGQFTGLVDKNGREIYEGDIINYDGFTWVGVVQWHPNGYFFIDDSYWKKYPRCDSYRSLGDMLDGRPLVVIGNVFDNSDLIKKGGEQ